MKVSRLTTKDNPFDPFTQFDEWQAFDEEKGYNTCAYLARIAHPSPELSESDQQIENEIAINDILQHDILQIYVKVSKDL